MSQSLFADRREFRILHNAYYLSEKTLATSYQVPDSLLRDRHQWHRIRTVDIDLTHGSEEGLLKLDQLVRRGALQIICLRIVIPTSLRSEQIRGKYNLERQLKRISEAAKQLQM